MVRDENFYQISAWMINKLGLKGTALSIYAIIYGFTQDGETEFSGGRKYLVEFTGTSLPTVDKALSELCDKNYIIKTSITINNVVFNRYKVNIETLRGVKKLYGGSKETLHNNKLQNDNFDFDLLKEEKENITKKNDNIEQEFEEIWKLYPRKEDKKKAFLAYKTARKKASFDEIKKGVETYSNHIKENNTDKCYIKLGATFLNGECWANNYEQRTKQGKANFTEREYTKEQLDIIGRVPSIEDYDL